MNDLPEDLAHPRGRMWPVGDIMGVVVGGALIVLLAALVTLWMVLPHG